MPNSILSRDASRLVVTVSTPVLSRVMTVPPDIGTDARHSISRTRLGTSLTAKRHHDAEHERGNGNDH